MSKRIASITASVSLSMLAALAAFTLATLTFTPKAAAQCLPGSWLCAQVQVGVTGGVYIGPSMPPPPPPPQIVYVQPQPQPPVVIYQPQPQTQVVYVQQRPQVQFVGIQPLSIAPAEEPAPRWGVHAELGAMTTGGVAMGGGGVAFRLRPSPWFALDLGVGSYGGQDYNGNDRVEVPFSANGLFFINPQSRWQFYLLGGLGASYAHTDGLGTYAGPAHLDMSMFGNDYSYFGGQLGVGLEWRMSRNFALNTDFRAFVRTRTDGGSTPEFTDPDTGATTDTSGGAYWTGGATLYW